MPATRSQRARQRPAQELAHPAQPPLLPPEGWAAGHGHPCPSGPPDAKEEEGPVRARAGEPPASLPVRLAISLIGVPASCRRSVWPASASTLHWPPCLISPSAAAGGGITFCHEAMAGSQPASGCQA